MLDHDHPVLLSRRSLIAGAGATALSALIAPRLHRTQQATMQLPSELRQALPQMMDLAAVPGVVLAAVDGDRVATVGLGVTRGGGRTVNPETVFEAASLGKPVFAWLVMLLARDGVLDLDRPLAEYLDLPDPSDERARAITARHILSHTTGWRNWRNTPADSLKADPEPGKRFTYSGEGFYFLSRVLERRTGAGILRLTRERVFAPLGMKRSAFLWLPELEENRAQPHTNRGIPADSHNARTGRQVYGAATTGGKTVDAWTYEDGVRLARSRRADDPVLPNFQVPNVAGSLLTTATDYGIFLRHILSDEVREIFRPMVEPQVRLNAALHWGLGLGLQFENGRARFWHWGDNFGFKNFVIGEPARRTALAIFTNGQNGRAVYERIVRATWGDQAAFLWI